MTYEEWSLGVGGFAVGEGAKGRWVGTRDGLQGSVHVRFF